VRFCHCCEITLLAHVCGIVNQDVQCSTGELCNFVGCVLQGWELDDIGFEDMNVLKVVLG
jgi:hypothetical protein